MRDVVAVDLKTHLVRVLARRLGAADADAYVNMAVLRRGVEQEFFADAPAGQYADGDKWASR